MERLILSEQGYREQMENVVEPYLDIRKSVLWPEREEGKKIYCERYLADSPKGVVMISHGFTETAEKYKEVIYYFVKKQYHVYLPEYCGHGRSYRLIPESSLVHVDDYQRYVDDFLYVAKMATKENPGLPVFLYGHSMGGGLAAAEAAQEPELFRKVVLSSPMIRPDTGNILWPVAKQIAFGACQQGKGAEYVVGQHPYEGRENFETSSSTCKVRFEYYQDKKEKEPLFQTNGDVIQLAVSGGTAEPVLAAEGVEEDSGSGADLPVGGGPSGVKTGTGAVCSKTCQTGTDLGNL